MEYRLSVVFCAVDETDSLERTFYKVKGAIDFDEVLFVLAQKSPSKTHAVVRKICANENCRCIIQTRPGLGIAVQEAIQAVTGTHILIWPADDEMDVGALAQMLAISKEAPEKIVTVSRWMQGGGFVGYSRVRKVVNFLSQKLFSALYGAKLTDYTNTAQIAPVAVYRAVRWEGAGFDLAPEMTFKPLRMGVSFQEVPCINYRRTEGQSHSSFVELVKYYFVVTKIRFMPIEKIYKQSCGVEDDER